MNIKIQIEEDVSFDELLVANNIKAFVTSSYVTKKTILHFIKQYIYLYGGNGYAYEPFLDYLDDEDIEKEIYPEVALILIDDGYEVIE